MPTWLQSILTVFGAVLASSGFWAFIVKKNEGKDSKTKMLEGLAHDRIVYLGMKYLDRGTWITNDEYENLYDYLWTPYQALGGNGSAKRVMAAVDKLDIVANPPLHHEGGHHHA